MPTNPSQVASNRRHFAAIGVTVPTKPVKPIRILDDGNIGRIADAQHLAAIPYFVFLVDYPSITNSGDKVALLAEHHTSMYVMHVVSFELVALALIVVTLGVFQHLQEHAPATSQVACAVGLIRAGLFLASVMVFDHGMSVVVDQQPTDPQQAAATWQVIETVADALVRQL